MTPGCCTYAGSFECRDVYISRDRTVILRYSDEGPDYLSMPYEIAQAVPHQLWGKAVDMIDDLSG
jgi:hypothetical protein